ncbi:MAG: hypothetical protein DMF63_03390 [Acidobacteria bacterium]|nr:MAG: hypothetical protein DMF63_03390 [Acidobacteriota bacterium]
MKKKVFLLLVVFVCFVSAESQTGRRRNLIPRPAAKSFVANNPLSELPIRRVILYSNGVAYIERRGFVNGNAEINLSFKQSQVDDVLKSMVVLDLNQGKIGAVSYNSSSPASARTAEIPFAVDAESGDEGGGISEVLAQMQGAKVFVSSTKGTAAGSILTVEKRMIAGEKDKPQTTTHFLVIASDTGEISSFDLADVRSVKLLDEGTKRDLNEFASATASTRRRDAKTITVTSEGAGQREMVVSYTIAAPIWKTTYRVVLDAEGKPFFQGWAIVDNVSDESWENVQLSLVSGSPVSFIQNLQKPLYRYRPIIPIPEDLNLRPQIYDPEVGEGSGSGSGNGSGGGSGDGNGNGDGAGGGPPPPKTLFEGANNNFIVSSGFAGTAVSDAIVNEKSGVQTAATGEEIGDLFEYKIEQPVSVERNRSALIPIIQTKMEGERVSIFRETPPFDDAENDDEDEETKSVRTANPRPMSGLLLKNITAMTFEGGSMTVLDRDAYAGEALMERLRPKEQRLISFALDLGTLVRVEQKEDREPARLVKVVNGVFQAHYFKSDKKIYRLTNQTERTRTVYIEHPVREGWILSELYAKPDYTTARFYRFRIELKPFESKEITVAENLGMMDKYNLTDLSPKDLDVFVASKFIDEPTRSRLAKLIDLRMKINEINAKLESSEAESEAISKDQERFRENIEALAKTPEAKQLIERYIAKANEQESRLEQITKSRQTMVEEKDRLERELAIEIKNFEIK